jgi:hypothetical protein
MAGHAEQDVVTSAITLGKVQRMPVSLAEHLVASPQDSLMERLGLAPWLCQRTARLLTGYRAVFAEHLDAELQGLLIERLGLVTAFLILVEERELGYAPDCTAALPSGGVL